MQGSCPQRFGLQQLCTIEIRAKMAPQTLATLAPLTALRVMLRSWRMTATRNKGLRLDSWPMTQLHLF